jgi:hypothetical protein
MDNKLDSFPNQGDMMTMSTESVISGILNFQNDTLMAYTTVKWVMLSNIFPKCWSIFA